MVVDTSAALAIYFGEPGGQWCVKTIDASQEDLWMCTVNLAECLIIAEDRSGSQGAAQIRADMEARRMNFVSPDAEMAVIAAQARHRFPLNLGDCFAYALAKTKGEALVTLDRDFRATDIDVRLPPPWR